MRGGREIEGGVREGGERGGREGRERGPNNKAKLLPTCPRMAYNHPSSSSFADLSLGPPKPGCRCCCRNRFHVCPILNSFVTHPQLNTKRHLHH